MTADFAAELATTVAGLQAQTGSSDPTSAISLTVMRLAGGLLTAGHIRELQQLGLNAVDAGQSSAIVWSNIASVAQSLGVEEVLVEECPELRNAGRLTADGWRRANCCGLARLANPKRVVAVCGDCPVSGQSSSH
jgi:hypothetical protein